MGHVIWTEPALDDVRSIMDHVAKDSPAYAARLGTRIVEAPRGLARFPHSGSIVPEFNRDDIREVLVRSYRIIYTIQDADCYVAAVIHGSRDLTRVIDPDDLESRGA